MVTILVTISQKLKHWKWNFCSLRLTVSRFGENQGFFWNAGIYILMKALSLLGQIWVNWSDFFANTSPITTEVFDLTSMTSRKMNQIIVLASLLKVLVFVKRNFYLHMQASLLSYMSKIFGVGQTLCRSLYRAEMMTWSIVFRLFETSSLVIIYPTYTRRAAFTDIEGRVK